MRLHTHELALQRVPPYGLVDSRLVLRHIPMHNRQIALVDLKNGAWCRARVFVSVTTWNGM